MYNDDPFLDVAQFAAMFRPLSAAETALATPLLEVVSDWIRQHKPGIDEEDAAARVVTFEVTRDALLYGKYAGFSQFQETVAHRSLGGTINPSAIEKWVTDRHRRMLGIAVLGTPVYSFPDADY